MTNHPNRNRLRQYAAKIVAVDGDRVVEMVDPNDNARRIFQYRRAGSTLARRVLCHDGSPAMDGSPWTQYTDDELQSLRDVRGSFHPILDPLGL